jgi:hypothetical protein
MSLLINIQVYLFSLLVAVISLKVFSLRICRYTTSRAFLPLLETTKTGVMLSHVRRLSIIPEFQERTGNYAHVAGFRSLKHDRTAWGQFKWVWRKGDYSHDFSCQDLPMLLLVGEQARHKSCEDQPHIEVLPQNSLAYSTRGTDCICSVSPTALCCSSVMILGTLFTFPSLQVVEVWF